MLSWNVAAIPEHDLEGFLARLSVEHAREVLVLPEFVAYARDSVEATDVGHRVGVGGRFFSCRWYFSRTEVVAVVWVALILQSLGRLNNIMELSSSSSSGIYDLRCSGRFWICAEQWLAAVLRRELLLLPHLQ